MTMFDVRRIAWVFALSVGLFTMGLAGEATAQKKSKSVQTEVIFVSFDPAAKTITARNLRRFMIRASCQLAKEGIRSQESGIRKKGEGNQVAIGSGRA